MTAPIVVVGDTLLDRDLLGRVDRLCPDAPVPVVDAEDDVPRPGGAGLAAVLAAGDDRPVVLVTALGADAPGRTVAGLLADRGVQVLDLGLDGPTPEKVRVRVDGRSLLRVDRGGGPGRVGPCPDAARAVLAGAAAVLVADYGRGTTSEPGLRAALAELSPRIPVVWDPHPRGAVPVAGARLATPNSREAAGLVPEVEGDGLAAHTDRARALAGRWQAASVAVTLGAGGALLATADVPPLVVPARPVVGGDPCGAGDRFAAAATTALADGALPSEAVEVAVAAASAFVGAGGASAALALAGAAVDRAPATGEAPARALIDRIRSAGGTVVAAGGCFDLLHAGHVSLLAAARSLGDCLVVCLNSDASVRRQKGAGRPYVNEADRAAVLLALGCVDGVAVFDEDTPLALLDRLRPDVFAKGADYAVADLPEAALLAGWGGQAVVLPYLGGRSTSGLAREVLSRSSR
ncbi:MAG TPA: PfkB family carbohydrate kinase [Acidimicrobiales bacterium]|nr:PfkB family carbohydrate kinase [Acidimicrobiales bacterium]